MVSVPIGIIWGFMAFLSWGFADYLARSYSSYAGAYRAALYVQVIGILPPIVVLVGQMVFDHLYTPADWRTWAMLTPAAGLLLAITYATYYRGLEIGKVSIVTTVSSAWLPVAVILAYIFLNESLSIQQGLLIAIVTIGALLLGIETSPQSNRRSTGFWYGAISIFPLAIIVTLFKVLTQAAGVMFTAISIKFVTAAIMWLFTRFKETPSKLPTEPRLGLILTAGLLDSSGYIFYIAGLSTAPIFLISPMAAASPIITMFLAWVLIRERISRMQSVGIGITLGAILLLSATARS